MSSNPCLRPLQAWWASWATQGLPITRQSRPLRIAVAYSGGADSTALLMAAWLLQLAPSGQPAASQWVQTNPQQVNTQQVKAQQSNAQQGFMQPLHQVIAVHVHHGLQAAADEFAAHCRGAAAKLDLPFHQIDLNLTVLAGHSSEALAREHRYAALASWAKQQGVDAVLLAHHAQDQAESVLLALTRGAGVAGLAGMPSSFEHGGVRFVRPLLGVSGQAIRQFLDQAGIAYLQDPMNADDRYTRSRIRQHLIPALAAQFEAYETLFARSASHAAKAAELLAEVAQSDLDAVCDPPAIRALQQLSPLRQANVLRYWLKNQCGFAPSTVQLQELQKQIAACQTRGHRIELVCASGVVRRVGDALQFELAG